MAHVLAALPRFQLDAKRIAATSVAIAVHVGLLLMLLMPMQTTSPPVEEEVVVVPDYKKPLPPPPPPPPPIAEQAPVRPVLQPQPVSIDPPPIESVDQQVASPVDVAIGPEVIEDTSSFDVGPVGPPFMQLTADVAPSPPYPRQALARRIAGKLVLRIRVDASGRPAEVLVESSSGSPILDEAARKFVQSRWHFVPATREGAPVEAWALLPIEYVLP